MRLRAQVTRGDSHNAGVAQSAFKFHVSYPLVHPIHSFQTSRLPPTRNNKVPHFRAVTLVTWYSNRALAELSRANMADASQQISEPAQQQEKEPVKLPEHLLRLINGEASSEEKAAMYDQSLQK